MPDNPPPVEPIAAAPARLKVARPNTGGETTSRKTMAEVTEMVAEQLEVPGNSTGVVSPGR